MALTLRVPLGRNLGPTAGAVSSKRGQAGEEDRKPCGKVRAVFKKIRLEKFLGLPEVVMRDSAGRSERERQELHLSYLRLRCDSKGSPAATGPVHVALQVACDRYGSAGLE